MKSFKELSPGDIVHYEGSAHGSWVRLKVIKIISATTFTGDIINSNNIDLERIDDVWTGSIPYLYTLVSKNKDTYEIY